MDKQKAIDELKYALEFTKTYRSQSDKAIREAHCLKLQVPHILVPIAEDDLIAGRMNHGFVGFSPQYGGLYTYYFHHQQVAEALNLVSKEVETQFIDEVKEMMEFWKTEATLERLNSRFQDKFGYRMPSNFHQPGFANCDGRIAGTTVDMDKFIRLGIPGMRDEIHHYKNQSGDTNFYEGLELALDTIADACRHYEIQALSLLDTLSTHQPSAVQRKKELQELVSILQHLQTNKPHTFKEGLQLFWIYAVVSDLMNYGRMDVYLGDLYAWDLEKGILTEEEAILYLESLYRHLIRIGKIHDSRIIIGGKGRRNEKNADLLALVIMETSRRVKDVVPQLTFRYYHGINEALFKKALEINAEGCTFPIIYSDETNIPAVMKAYEVSREEAEHYLPFGCGEYVLEGLSTGTPNNGINLLKALELALHNGYDPVYKMQLGSKTGEARDFHTFEDVWNAYCEQLEPEIIKLAWHKRLNYTVANEQASYLHMSLLMDDCISRGKALLDGGVRYLNASSEIFGIMSTADSFTAIKKCVYDDKVFTFPELVNMLDANFEGYEKQRKMLFNAPKYGNDDDYADTMAQKVFHHIAQKTIEAGKVVGLHKYLMVSVNNSMSAEWGKYCAASPCGRKKGDPMANGNGASIGADKNGITALLNSMSKIDPSEHVGVIHNIRFTKEMFKSSFDKIKLLLMTFYEHNGVQTNITAVGKEDLEQAMLHPEKYQNLLVRIGGFSARFVELNPIVQNEILLRTTYDN